MNVENEENTKLENNRQDRIALVLKGFAGAVPYAGGIFAEIIGDLIPNQRQDRIVEFIKLLEQRLIDIEKDNLNRKLKEERNIDLFEDACFQAARALSDERLEYIANALTNSLTQEELEYLYKKKLLWLLSELNDNEVIFLTYYYHLSYTEEREEFLEKHGRVLDIPILTISENDEEKEEEATFKQSYLEKLVQLDLIKPNYKKTKRGELPEFDYKTGRIKSSGYRITQLGYMFIRFINKELECSE